MEASDRLLWEQIESYEVDKVGASWTLSDKVASENGWTAAYTKRAVLEYKRFVYLAMVAEHVVCPSDQVDQIWHTHLLYTRSYWNDFCKTILPKPLHHSPSSGGEEEEQKYRALYRETLVSYEETFGCVPPIDIWPTVSERFEEALRCRRINLRRYWVLPRLSWLWGRGQVVLAALLPMALLGWTNPLGMKGPAFLGFFFSLSVGALLVTWFIRNVLVNLASQAVELEPPLDTSELACLVAGPSQVVELALTHLHHGNALRIISPKQFMGLTFGKAKYRFERVETSPPEMDDLEARLYEAVDPKEGALVKTVLLAGTEAASKIYDRLAARGLLLPRYLIPAVHKIPVGILLGLFVLGVIKVAIGIENEKPVGFLIAFCVVAWLMIFNLRKRRHFRTSAGEEMLNKRRLDSQSLLKALEADSGASPKNEIHDPNWLYAAALFGLPAVGGQWRALESAWRNSSVGSSSRHSSGCGGDSGCSGGGEGCGGCGGD